MLAEKFGFERTDKYLYTKNVEWEEVDIIESKISFDLSWINPECFIKVNNLTTNFNINVHGELLDNKILKKKFINIFSSFLLAANVESSTFMFKKPILVNEMNFWIIVHFKNYYVSSIVLENAEESLINNYNNWSNYKFKKKKESHDLWLKKNFGEPDDKKGKSIIYFLSFGQITSYIDQKSGEVGIAIEYK